MSIDWASTITSLTVILVPLLVIAIKKRIPEEQKWVIPIVATALGAVLDTLTALLQSGQLRPQAAVVAGLASVGLREIVDQWRKG